MIFLFFMVSAPLSAAQSLWTTILSKSSLPWGGSGWVERKGGATEEQLWTSSRMQRYVNYANRANIPRVFNIV